MASIIAKNNSWVLNTIVDQIPSDEKCNCRNKTECPLPRKCLIQSVIYQGSVKTATGEETYIGLTANSFKARFGGHHLSRQKPEQKKLL